MSIPDMVKAKPPSPPSSHNGDLFQNGFQHLVRHNANTSYPHEGSNYDDGTQMSSDPRHRFGSPGPLYHGDGFEYQGQQSYMFPNGSVGLGIRYGGYQVNPTHMMHHRPSPNEYPVYGAQFDTPARSPATTVTSTPGSEITRARGDVRSSHGLKSLPRTNTQSTASPKGKRPKKTKTKSEKKITKVDQPLSLLTKDWTNVPVEDIEAYVNRSAEERRKEVESGKNPGKIKRPMNSFMLYRKAYQSRTKAWCLENNHQVVSQVCGDSWPLEPEAVREQFNEWARLERINHANAHPGYKFTPSKGGISKPGKRKASDEPESEESDLDDFEWRPQSAKKPKKHAQHTPEPEQHLNRRLTNSPYHFSRESSLEPGLNGYHSSSYEVSNPGRLAPPQYDQSGLQPGQYYEQVIQSNTSMPNVEDVIIKRTSAPGSHYPSYPSDQEFGFSDPYSLELSSLHPEDRIDPSLMNTAQSSTPYAESYTNGSLYLGDDGLDIASDWSTPYGMSNQDFHNMPLAEFSTSGDNFDNLQISPEHLEMLKGSHEGWQIETLDPGQEFDKWLDETS